MKKLDKNIYAVVTCSAILFSAVSMSAQSTVYFFFPALCPGDYSLKFNGEEISCIIGPFKKVITSRPSPFEHYTIRIHEATRQKCVIKEEGKAIFTCDMDYFNPVINEQMRYACEIQLNLADGDTHYVKLALHGLQDVKFVEISEKKGKKYLKSKKYVQLSDYIEE